MSRIDKRPHRPTDEGEQRSDQELVEDTIDETPVETAADQTVAETTMVAAPEDRTTARPRKRPARERR